VIPAYNAERHLVETLRSLSGQTLTDWEAVVVDDGSGDGTARVAEQHGDSRVRVFRQANAGVCAARNRGMAEGHAPLVLFLDADDRLRPDALERLAAALEHDVTLAAAYGEATVIDASGRVAGTGRRPWFTHRPSGNVVRPLLGRNFLYVGAVMARREAVSAAGNFDTTLRLYEDWEFWCRLSLQGPFAYIGGEPVLEYRRTPGGAVALLGADERASFRALDATFSHPAIRSAVSAPELVRLRQRSEAAVYSFHATQHLKARAWRAARTAIGASLRRQPWQPREWVLLACALTGYLPPALLRQLK
jgi:glycosyltransferase involved in cell wall biosynthesis